MNSKSSVTDWLRALEKGDDDAARRLLAVRLCETAIAFRNVGCDRKRCAVHLIGQMVVAGWELLRYVADLVGEVY